MDHAMKIMQCRKNITVEDDKKRMNIANFLNTHTNIYLYYMWWEWLKLKMIQ